MRGRGELRHPFQSLDPRGYGAENIKKVSHLNNAASVWGCTSSHCHLHHHGWPFPSLGCPANLQDWVAPIDPYTTRLVQFPHHPNSPQISNQDLQNHAFNSMVDSHQLCISTVASQLCNSPVERKSQRAGDHQTTTDSRKKIPAKASSTPNATRDQIIGCPGWIHFDSLS